MLRMNHQIKECYNYFLKTVDSKEYKEYSAQREATHRETHTKYTAERTPDRTDLYEPECVAAVKVFDVLSNTGVSKLLKKIYALTPVDYKTEIYYKEPSLLHHYDYVHLQLAGTGNGSFAEVTFLHDKYIKKIEITWAQINSFSAFMEYTIHFIKCLDEDAHHQFVLDTIRCLNGKDFRVFYLVRHNNPIANYEWMEQIENELFHCVCQHYITSLFFSEYGKKTLLNNLVFMTRKEPIDIKTLDLGLFTTVYHNKKENYVILRYTNEPNYYLLAGNNIIPRFNAIHFISKYGNSFYYDFNGLQELKLLERHFSQFTSGRKAISKKALIALINRLQGLREDYWTDSKHYSEQLKEKWDIYASGKLVDQETISRSTDYYRRIFDDYAVYFRNISDINATESNRLLAVAAIIVAIIGIVLQFII